MNINYLPYIRLFTLREKSKYLFFSKTFILLLNSFQLSKRMITLSFVCSFVVVFHFFWPILASKLASFPWRIGGGNDAPQKMILRSHQISFFVRTS